MKNSFRMKHAFIILTGFGVFNPSVYAETPEQQFSNQPASSSTISASSRPTQQQYNIINKNLYTLSPGYASHLFSQSRGIYSHLQLARQAALNKNISAFRSAIALAQMDIKNLQLPGPVKSLDNQLSVIYQDIKRKDFSSNEESNIYTDRWIPVEQKLGNALLYYTNSFQQKTRTSVQNGWQATKRNDHKSALTSWNELVLASDYNIGVFPLTRVNQDIDSAIQSVNYNRPYWPGAIEAIQSALATFHWFSQTNSRDLLTAYTDIVGAYALASAPYYEDGQRQTILNQLIKAKNALKKTTGEEVLQAKTKALIDVVVPTSENIKRLLVSIHQQIIQQRHQAEKQYLQNISEQIIIS